MFDLSQFVGVTLSLVSLFLTESFLILEEFRLQVVFQSSVEGEGCFCLLSLVMRCMNFFQWFSYWSCTFSGAWWCLVFVIACGGWRMDTCTSPKWRRPSWVFLRIKGGAFLNWFLRSIPSSFFSLSLVVNLHMLSKTNESWKVIAVRKVWFVCIAGESYWKVLSEACIWYREHRMEYKSMCHERRWFCCTGAVRLTNNRYWKWLCPLLFEVGVLWQFFGVIVWWILCGYQLCVQLVIFIAN